MNKEKNITSKEHLKIMAGCVVPVQHVVYIQVAAVVV